jgi:cobalt/nickel transport system permease protein
MALAHLTVAGLVEAALTVGVIAFLQRANIPVLRINHPHVPLEDGGPAPRRLGWRWAIGGLGVMVVLSPLGLLAPGGAFAEDAPAKLDLGRYGLRVVPTGLARWSSFWDRAVLGGYGFKDGQHPNIGYVLSAVVGVIAVGVAVVIMFFAARLGARLFARRGSATVVAP